MAHHEHVAALLRRANQVFAADPFLRRGRLRKQTERGEHGDHAE
jgi:hypothetical protein